MTSSVQNRFWWILALVFVVAVWALRPILLPFAMGVALAYFLDPVVKKLTSLRLPRSLGAALVLLGFLFVVALAIFLIEPLIQSQLSALIDSFPSYVGALRDRFLPRVTAWMERLSPDDVSKLRDAAGSYAGTAALWAGDVIKRVISQGFAFFDVATLIVITPVVAFYLLRDWPGVTAGAQALVPRKNMPLFQKAVSEIDKTLSGFLRGQALVCLSLGLIYGVGLTLVGLKYGASVGIIAGFLSFMPYVGSSFCLVVSMVLAFVQFSDPLSIGLTFSVFLVGQTLEGYVLTPKLVGDRVGLHPVWILFALFAGASLLGFLGVLIAVPVAAVIGVLVRLAIGHYKKSALYERRSVPR